MKAKYFFVVIVLFSLTSVLWAKNPFVLINEAHFVQKDNYGNTRKTTISPFHIASKMVTVREWSSYLEKTKKDASQWQRSLLISLDDYSLTSVDADWPAWNISWLEAIEYCNWLSIENNRTPCYEIVSDDANNVKVIWVRDANGYRLPTATEWLWVSELLEKPHAKAYFLSLNWFAENSNSGPPKKVGTLPVNTFGLFDILGTMSELCWDYYNPYSRFEKEAINPSGPLSFIPDPDQVYFNDRLSETRVVAGGDWGTYIDSILKEPFSWVVVEAKDFCGLRLVLSAP